MRFFPATFVHFSNWFVRFAAQFPCGKLKLHVRHNNTQLNAAIHQLARMYLLSAVRRANSRKCLLGASLHCYAVLCSALLFSAVAYCSFLIKTLTVHKLKFCKRALHLLGAAAAASPQMQIKRYT